MPKRLTVRPVSPAEIGQLERLSRSRTAAQRSVERCQIILGLLAGQSAEQMAIQVGRSMATIYNQIHQFNERGLAFIEDLPRAGRPMTYNETQRGQMMALARTHPQQMGLPFGHWTLDRLVVYLHEQMGLGVSRSQLGEILEQEGLKWYQEKTFFTERPDPQFAEKRGRL
jgi:transposase